MNNESSLESNERMNVEYLFRRFAKLAVQTIRDNHVARLVLEDTSCLTFAKFNEYLHIDIEYAHEVAKSIGLDIKIDIDQYSKQTSITLGLDLRDDSQVDLPAYNFMTLPARAFILKFDTKIQNWAFTEE